ncbi:hypothetical protein LJC46_04255 [Desulfovibrio sp. OttesenSCG-928-G15]|nr:hypothetical protein [Desulfovibrio sp. OttesenSCG-928-G15]
MTVESLKTKVIYKGNGSTNVWPFPYQYSKTDTIFLVLTDAKGKDSIVTSNYRIDVNASGNTSVVYPVTGAAIASGTKLTVFRNTPLTQIVDLIYGGAFNPEMLESSGFDRIVMMVQEIQEQIDRAVKVSISDENPPTTAEDFYEDMQGFADAAAESAARSEAAADKSEQMYDKVRETGDTAVTRIREAEVQALGAIGSAGVAEVERVRKEGKAWTEAACACAQTACECADEAWRAVASIPGIEAAQFTINALNIVDGVLVWSQGRAGAVMRVSDYDWCSGPEHASIYYTLNNQGEVVRRLPVAPPAIIGG